MENKQILSSVLDLIKTVAMVFIIAFVLKTFLIQTYIVEGQSMEPNFHSGEYLLIDKLSYRLKDPARGDIIILIPPDDQSKNYIKRVIGLPGDTIEISHNQVIINGSVLEEAYLGEGERTVTGDSEDNQYKVTLSNDQFFVLGDNRLNSRDSRAIGTVPRENILGKTFAVLLPFKDAHVIAHQNYRVNAATNQLTD